MATKFEEKFGYLKSDPEPKKEKLDVEKLKQQIRDVAPIPKPGGRKVSVTIRLDPDIVIFFESHGKGWQTVINEVLRDYVEAHKEPLK